MNVGVVAEIKPAERRVALTPPGARELVADGHAVRVESGAGQGSGFLDSAYVAAGAILGSQAEVWGQSDLVVKVKEPIASEYGFLRRDLVLFTYLHLAADAPLTDALVAAFGVDEAIAADAGFGLGVNVRDGEILCAPVVAAHQLALSGQDLRG
jgi:alanine dehydrogenase